ncbi:hypothetical protein NLM31_12735 [Bradyrhizobium sp. CCGUVB4N]|uniref:DUF2130 domain-containing protein n=1 Tax=Bradyrhizobium sp. CCGUVB4N TaxID=2949631 RepID=UPI0020B34713|nr:hypothetical protein [Bradyrhizobium sp. CCGUVB4N]MCP3381206.1 hypothetical protein [Bradyrhizobium sp. CCGUVB4N]
MASLQPALHPDGAVHVHAGDEVCPYCEQPISNERAGEIRARFEADTLKQTAALQARMEEQFKEAREQIEADNKAATQKILQDHVAVIEQIKSDALARENAARAAAKQAAEDEMKQKLEAIVAQQEATTLRAVQAEREKSEAMAALAKVKADQETTIAARTDEVRTAMEQKNSENIATLTVKHATDMAKISEQMSAMQRRLDAEEAEGADVKLLEELKKRYPKDEITALNKSSGADIIHVVKHNNKVCGKIVYDSRNRNGWQASFVTKLREDMVSEKADHAFLTTSKFPTGARQVHGVEGVIAANPARVMAIVGIVREEIVRFHTLRLSEEDRSQKTAKLYDFIVSEGFAKLLGSVEGNDEKLLQLDVDEKKAHDKVWEKRGILLKSSQKLHAKLREEIECIIGTSETD